MSIQVLHMKSSFVHEQNGESVESTTRRTLVCIRSPLCLSSGCAVGSVWLQLRRQAVAGTQGPGGAPVRRVGADFGSNRHRRADDRKAGLREQGELIIVLIVHRLASAVSVNYFQRKLVRFSSTCRDNWYQRAGGVGVNDLPTASKRK